MIQDRKAALPSSDNRNTVPCDGINLPLFRFQAVGFYSLQRGSIVFRFPTVKFALCVTIVGRRAGSLSPLIAC